MSTQTIHIKKVESDFPQQILNDLMMIAAEGFPLEVCGVIHSRNIIHQYPNTFAGDKRHGFDMEVDIDDRSIRALWHSHPFGPEEPSTDDIPCMDSLAQHGFNYPWIIVTPKSVTEWVGVLY